MSIFASSDENLDLEKDFKTEQHEDEYRIKIPKYMKADTGLHADASLAFQSSLKEVAILILDENIKEFKDALQFLNGYDDSASFIENYANIQINLISQGLLYPESGDIVVNKIDEYPAAQVWMEGRIDGLNIAYFITCIETEKKVYFIMSYTSKEKKTKFEDTFKKIGSSFELINASGN